VYIIENAVIEKIDLIVIDNLQFNIFEVYSKGFKSDSIINRSASWEWATDR